MVAWAAENGIVEGYGDGTYFGPDDPVTREQLAVILMRFAAFQGKDVSGRGDLEFPDAGTANDWALDALSWAVSEGLILGDDTTGELNPIDGPARRAGHDFDALHELGLCAPAIARRKPWQHLLSCCD